MYRTAEARRRWAWQPPADAFAGRQLDRVQEIRAGGRVVQGLNRQQIRARVETADAAADVEGLEVHGVRIGVAGGGGRVPRRRAGEQCPLDLDAVEIGDEPVIVADLQHQRGQTLQGVGGDGERDADVAACGLAVHLALHIDREQGLVAGASLVADAAGAARVQAAVIERRVRLAKRR